MIPMIETDIQTGFQMEDAKNFHFVDYIIFVATVVASLTIGMYFAFCKRKNYSSVEYFFGGKNLSFVPVAFSFIVTFQSSLLILGIPAEVYGYGMKFSLEAIGIAIAFILGPLISVPVFRPLQITSIYKYFNLRYGSNEVRFIAAALGIIYLVFYMAAVVLGTCVALKSVFRVPFWITNIIYTSITAVYTSLGGFKAVIWTDVVQLVIMITGIIAVLTKSTANAGGVSEVYKLSEERFDVADFRLDPTIRHTVWISTFGPITQFLVLFFTQAGLQRIKATPNAASTYKMFIMTTPLYCLITILCFFEGVCIFAYYASSGCDPLASGRISNINEIVPTAVMDLFNGMPGLTGLFLACLSSAALSTLSSCLTGLSSITFEDIIKIKYPRMTDEKATKLSKAAVFVYGALSMGLAFLMSLLTGPVVAIFQALIGSIDGPTCGVFILSIFFLRSTTKGVITGALSGMILSMVFSIGQTFIAVPSHSYLPLGPTDRCFTSNLTNISSVVENATNKTIISLYMLNLTSTPFTINNTVTLEMNGTPGHFTILQKIFGVSFMLLSLMGFLVTITVGIIVSILTKPTPKENIDLMTLYPLPHRFCCLFPEDFFYSKRTKEEIDKIKGESTKLMTESCT